MNIVEDFNQWYKTKESFLESFQEIDSLIFIRLEPIINVLKHLSTVDMDDSEFYIFDIGMMYLLEQVMSLERYVELLSKEGVEHSSILYNYLMETIDVYEDGKLEEENRKELELLIQDLEAILIRKEALPEELYQDIEHIKSTLQEEYASVTEIYSEIAFEYQIL